MVRPTSVSPGNAADLKHAIVDEARAIGFDAVGFSAASLPDTTGAALIDWLDLGSYGDMGWMAAKAERRRHPQALWPEARSVIVCAASYAPAVDPLAVLERRDEAAVSVYAQGRDYHDVLKKRLKRLARWLQETHGGDVKVFVDTAPVMEKPLAAAAGLGWQGKHTNLVSRTHGSWLFLGEVFTTLAIASDEPHADRCGTCRSCLDVCPTDAFPAPYRIDARRCISYLTIEHKGHIAREFRAAMGNRIYGCDDCLAVCPWNKFAVQTKELAFTPREALTAPKLAALAALDDAAFRAMFAGSPIKRTGRDRFIRNVLIAIGNSGTPYLAPVAEARLGDASPLVRAMAVWALARLLDGPRFTRLRNRHMPSERDTDVRAEWSEAASG
ncbi:MAG TPA: tRNA epoxyqueuosine(34) reductase QueG [Alphaproteobacteria bacterium]|nr:tRNA epoxyqueuosine(34) reductase QueG [Alphaproteobacteria bacterium]